MTITEIIALKAGHEPRFRYYPYGETYHEIVTKELKNDGWTILQTDLVIDEWDEKRVAAFLETMAYRFFQKGQANR